MRIMYVEDNAINLGLVQRIAKMGNHEVVSHANGPDALKALETEEVDLILMDIELEGEMDGIEVVKRLRARGDKRPIVAVTAYAMVGDKDRILAAGCNGYLPKPLPVAQFLQILAKYDPANSPRATQEAKAVSAKRETSETPTTSKDTPAQTSPAAVATTTSTEKTTPEKSDDKTTTSSSDSTPSAEKKPDTESKSETETASTTQSTPPAVTASSSDTTSSAQEKPDTESKSETTTATASSSATSSATDENTDTPSDKSASNISQITSSTPNQQE